MIAVAPSPFPIALFRRRPTGDPDELNPDPEFNSPAGWTMGAGWSIADGFAIAANTFSYIFRTAPPLTGPVRLTYEIFQDAGGQVAAYVDSVAITGQPQSLAGIHSDDLTPVSGNEYGLRGNGFTGRIEFLSVKLIQGE